MLAAKHRPGVYNTSYISGMNISSSKTGIISCNMDISECYNKAGTPAVEPLGTGKYTVIMYCPTLSILYGSGAAGAIPATSKLAGFSIT